MASGKSARGYMLAVVLLTLALIISYADRGNLSIVASAVREELKIDPLMLGYVMSAFFWAYALAQPLFGVASAHFGGRNVLAVGLAIWALATLFTGFAHGLAMLFALRLLLGLGEAAVFPCMSHIIADIVPEEKRGRANGIIMSGIAIGPAIGAAAAGFLFASLGWRPVFIIFGVASLIWLVPWLLLPKPEKVNTHAPHPSGWTPGFFDVVMQRKAWGISIGHFCTNYIGYFVLSWVPSFLKESQGFSIALMTTVATAIYVAQAIGSFSSGFLSDYFITRGREPGAVRKAMLMGALGVEVLCMAGIALASGSGVVVLLVLAGFCHGFLSPMLYASAQTLSGPAAAAQWMGFQNGIANISGILATIVTGWIVQVTGSFYGAFTTAAGVGMFGLLMYLVVMGRVVPIIWAPREPRLAKA